MRCAMTLLVVMMMATTVSLAKDTKLETEQPRHPKRFNRQPTAQFIRGNLSCDHLGNYAIGETAVWLKPDCVIVDQLQPDKTVTPSQGDEVLLMGYRAGGVFFALRGVRVPVVPLQQTGFGQQTEVMERSEVDPTLGWGKPSRH
jgi:hypothetical protein